MAYWKRYGYGYSSRFGNYGKSVYMLNSVAYSIPRMARGQFNHAVGLLRRGYARACAGYLRGVLRYLARGSRAYYTVYRVQKWLSGGRY